MFAGTVTRMWRWPVKSMRGETVRSAAIDYDGMTGDRRLGVYRPGTDDKLWGGSHPRMLAWEAAYPAECGCADGASGAPVLYAPGGAAWAADDPGLPAAIAADLGESGGVELRPVRREYGRVLVVFESSLKRLSEQLGRDVEAERFRPNLMVEADADAFAEAAFERGMTMRIGDGAFTVQKPCERCVLPSWDPFGRERDKELHRHLVGELGNHFGVYLRIDKAVTVRTGDEIAWTP